MNRAFATIVVPAAQAPLLSVLASIYGPGALAFGSTSECGAGGVPSHYITSGLLGEAFLASLASAQDLRAALESIVSLSAVEAAEFLGALDISAEPADVTLQRLGFALSASPAEVTA